MPNIKFGRRLTITKDDLDDKDDDIEVVEQVKVQDASPNVVIKKDVEERKVSLSFRKTGKKTRKDDNVDDNEDKIVEARVAKCLDLMKTQMMEEMSKREEKVIKIIKMKDMDLSKMKFHQECQSLEWSEKTEIFRKEAAENGEMIKNLEKENQELKKERNYRQESLMSLQDKIYQMSSENEELKQKSDEMGTLRAEVEASQEECKRQAERLKTLQTELETCQQQLRNQSEENRKILEAGKTALENQSKLNQELKEKDGLLEEWKRKAEEKERELRIHKKELKSRVEQSNKTIEDLRKQLESTTCHQAAIRENDPKTKEKEQTAHQQKEGVTTESSPKNKEKEFKENQLVEEKQTAVGNPRDPRIKKGQIRRTSVEPKNFSDFHNFELKKNNSFFSTGVGGGNRYKADNPFDQRPLPVKRKDYERYNERKEDMMRKPAPNKWKYDREPRYNGQPYQRGRPAHQDYHHRTWSH